MKTFFYQCVNLQCSWFRQLVILQMPELAPGIINVPKLMCDCGHEPAQLKVREVK